MSATIESKREHIRRILQLPPPPPGHTSGHSASEGDQHKEAAAREMEEAVTSYLRRATDNFDLSKNVEVRVCKHSFSIG